MTRPVLRHLSGQRQEAVFRAYVETGSVKGAAHRMGITERAVRRHINDYCARRGFKSWVHAVFRFGTSEREAEPLG